MDFSENLRVLAIKLLEIKSHHQIYQFTLCLYGVGARCARGRFSVRSPFIEKSTDHEIQTYIYLKYFKYFMA